MPKLTVKDLTDQESRFVEEAIPLVISDYVCEFDFLLLSPIKNRDAVNEISKKYLLERTDRLYSAEAVTEYCEQLDYAGEDSARLVSWLMSMYYEDGERRDDWDELFRCIVYLNEYPQFNMPIEVIRLISLSYENKVNEPLRKLQALEEKKDPLWISGESRSELDELLWEVKYKDLVCSPAIDFFGLYLVRLERDWFSWLVLNFSQTDLSDFQHIYNVLVENKLIWSGITREFSYKRLFNAFGLYRGLSFWDFCR